MEDETTIFISHYQITYGYSISAGKYILSVKDYYTHDTLVAMVFTSHKKMMSEVNDILEFMS